MKRKAVLQLLAGLAASGGLTACADTIGTPAPPTQTAPSTPAAPTSANATGPASQAAPTATPALPQTTGQATLPPTTTPGSTSAVSPAVPPTAAPTPAAPTAAPATPTPTAPPFTPTLTAVSPANSGYYFTFAADGRLVFYARANNQAGSWAATLGNPAWQFLAPGFGNFTPDRPWPLFPIKPPGQQLLQV
jgi:hypothetical protein